MWEPEAYRQALNCRVSELRSSRSPLAGLTQTTAQAPVGLRVDEPYAGHTVLASTNSLVIVRSIPEDERAQGRIRTE